MTYLIYFEFDGIETKTVVVKGGTNQIAPVDYSQDSEDQIKEMRALEQLRKAARKNPR